MEQAEHHNPTDESATESSEFVKPLAYILDEVDRLIVVNANTKRRNALSPEFYAVLAEALNKATHDPRITSVIIRGEGGYFCSGGDLNYLAKRRDMSRQERVENIEALHDLIRLIRACPKMVIAAVDGGAAGAGLSIALACDFVIAANDAMFVAAYVKAGLAPDGGLTASLAAVLPKAMVNQMCLLAEPVSAERFMALGAITSLSAPLESVHVAMQLADRISLGATHTMGAIKGVLNTAATNDFNDQMNAEREVMADALGGDDAAEGIAAFLEKRPTDFTKLRVDAEPPETHVPIFDK